MKKLPPENSITKKMNVSTKIFDNKFSRDPIFSLL